MSVTTAVGPSRLDISLSNVLRRKRIEKQISDIQESSEKKKMEVCMLFLG